MTAIEISHKLHLRTPEIQRLHNEDRLGTILDGTKPRPCKVILRITEQRKIVEKILQNSVDSPTKII